MRTQSLRDFMYNLTKFISTGNYSSQNIPGDIILHPDIRKKAYHEALAGMLNTAYDHEKSVQVKFLNGSQQNYIIHEFLKYVQTPENVKQAALHLGKSMPKERRKTKQSVDDFIDNLSFIKEGNCVRLTQQSLEFTLDLCALSKHL